MNIEETRNIVENLVEIGLWRSIRDGGLSSRILFERDGGKVLWRERSLCSDVFDSGILKDDGRRTTMESASHRRTRSRHVEPLPGQKGYFWRTVNGAATGTLFPV